MGQEKKRIKELSPEDIQKSIGDISSSEGHTRFEFACKFNELLSDKNIEQAQFADDNKMSKSVISDYRHGKTEPKISALRIVADYFKVSADYMLGISNVKSRKESEQKISATIGLDEEAQKQLGILKDNELSKMIINKMFAKNLITDLVSLIQSNVEYVFVYNKLDEIKMGSVNSLAIALNKQYEYVKWKTEQSLNNVVENITTELINELPNSFINYFNKEFEDKYYDEDVIKETEMLEMLIEELSIFRKFADKEDKEYQ